MNNDDQNQMPQTPPTGDMGSGTTAPEPSMPAEPMGGETPAAEPTTGDDQSGAQTPGM